MINMKFAKEFSEMSDEDWKNVYEYKKNHGSLYLNTFKCWEDMKRYYYTNMNQVDTVKRILENDDWKVDYVDKERAIIKTEVGANILPDLVVTDNIYKTKTIIDVKMLYPGFYCPNHYVKTCVWVNVFGLSEKEIFEKIWKKVSHNADILYFINNECDQYCWVTAEEALYGGSIRGMKLGFKPDTTIIGKQRIVIYLPASDLNSWH